MQKNYGASLAKGEYLLFLDSDAEMEADVVKECVNLIEEKDLDCIIIPEIQVGYGFWSKVKAYPFLRKAFIKKIHLIIRHPILFLCIFIIKGMESLFFFAGFGLYKFNLKKP